MATANNKRKTKRVRIGSFKSPVKVEFSQWGRDPQGTPWGASKDVKESVSVKIRVILTKAQKEELESHFVEEIKAHKQKIAEIKESNKAKLPELIASFGDEESIPEGYLSAVPKIKNISPYVKKIDGERVIQKDEDGNILFEIYLSQRSIKMQEEKPSDWGTIYVKYDRLVEEDGKKFYKEGDATNPPEFLGSGTEIAFIINALWDSRNGKIDTSRLVYVRIYKESEYSGGGSAGEIDASVEFGDDEGEVVKFVPEPKGEKKVEEDSKSKLPTDEDEDEGAY